jgi:integrase/recombinase XerD
MEAANVREASARVILALKEAGRSRTTIKRHEAEFNAFARFLREPTSSRPAQLARRPLILLMECLDGGMPEVGQATTPSVDRCASRFRVARDEYLAACRRRGNAEAGIATKRCAVELFLGYLDEVGRETLGQVETRDLAGFWARRQRRGYAPKTIGSLRSGLADFLRYLREAGEISAIPGAASRPRIPGRLRKSAWSSARSTGDQRSANATTRWSC